MLSDNALLLHYVGFDDRIGLTLFKTKYPFAVPSEPWLSVLLESLCLLGYPFFLKIRFSCLCFFFMVVRI